MLNILAFTPTLIGQQHFLNNQRNWNDLMFNPAKIVETNGTAFYTTYRRQFVGLGNQAPFMTIIGAKTNLPVNYSMNMLKSQAKRNRKFNHAIGGYYIHSNYGGVFDQNEISGQFAFQLKFDEDQNNPTDFNQLNFGIALKGVNKRYRGSGLDLLDPNDPVFNQFEATNSFSFSVTPGIQLSTRKVSIDALINLGSMNQKFASFTLSGSENLENMLRLMALRINYFNNDNIQLSFHKIIDFQTVFQHNWALNFGVNALFKEPNSNQLISNPGFYAGFIFRTNSDAKKTKQDFHKPSKYNHFSGSLNLFDVNTRTFSLGPSSEIGLLYSRNSKACECDQIYDEFIINYRQNSKGNNLEILKRIEADFTSKCNTREYQICYVGYRDKMRDLIKEADEESKEEVEASIDYPTTKLFGQEWYCANLDYYKGTGIRLITNQEDWDKYSPTSPCCCYIEFNENNKSKGLCYNKMAFERLANSQELKNSKFRIATSNDWTKLFDNAKKSNSLNSLYNCDGRNPNGFNLQSGGYYEYDWIYRDMTRAAYWVGESNVFTFDCTEKGYLLIDEISNEDVQVRNETSAFMIRLIKK